MRGKHRGRTAGVAGRHFSLREQLTTLVIVAVFGAVILATGLFAAREVNHYDAERSRELRANAVIFAATIAGPVREGDERRTLEALRAISGLPHIKHIRVLRADGSVFVELGGSVALAKNEGGGSNGVMAFFADQSIAAEAPVIEGGEKIGALILSADTSELGEKISEIFWDSLVAALFSATIALLIALRMQRGVTAPIIDLVRLMRKVRETDDFGARARLTRKDETGELVEAFNDMLDKIQDRDARLLAQQQNLQKTVMQRTHELKLAKEAAEAANNAKSDFLATVSHEIRTPMNGLLVMAELINNSDLPPRQKRYADVIVRSGKSLLTIINDILDFSKIEAGKLDLEKIPVRPADLIADVISLFWERAQKSGVDLVSYVGPGVPESIEGDPVRISQVISNLVNNALKFTTKGSVIVAARQLRTKNASVTIEISVADTGIGIPEDKLGSIFEAFSQADQSTTRKFGGTGLGLAICRRLVEAMGGEIGVTSKMDKGSRFHFTLPTREIESPRVFPRTLGDKRALVAIPGSATPLVVARYLEEAGVAVQIVSIDAIQTQDLSYADIILASPNALAAVYRRYSGDHEGWTPARICVSDFGDDAPDRLLSTGVAEDLLIKPITRQDMIALVERILEGRLRGREALQSVRAPDTMTVSFFGARVLAADDSAVNREVVREALSRLGIETALATNGEEAVAAVEAGAFDLVLMDCSMPVMDGYAATAAIRNLADPARARTPIIALTAHVEGEEKSWQNAGMNGYLTKPFTLTALANAIGQFLKPAGSPAPAPNSAPIEGRLSAFDTAALYSLAEMSASGSDLVLRSLTLFEKHGREGMVRLAAAFRARDAKEVASAAHALKSMSYNIGAKALGEACARVERSAADIAALPPLLKQLDPSKNLSDFWPTHDSFEG
jgi:signal transduction histidine kinase/CheY-like chemotaxis protein/HPt (histidine-containing phosphotransfer) domain-containing protein